MEYNSSDFRSRIETEKSFGVMNTPGDKRRLFFEFKDPTPEMPVPKGEIKAFIEDYKHGCECTKMKIHDDGIEIMFTYPKKKAEWDEKYPDRRVPYSTSITLYFKDGRPMKKLDDTGGMVLNMDKTKIALTVHGTLEF